MITTLVSMYQNIRVLSLLKLLPLLLLVLTSTDLLGQSESDQPKFYLGFSYGASFSLGDFADTDINNPDAGFAKNGNKIDLFLGVPVDNKISITGVIRYQNFETDVEDLVNDFREANPGIQFTGTTEDWQTFSALVGISYQIKLSKNFGISPRFGLGPMFVKNPGFNVSDISGAAIESIDRSSETGFGLGYEFGFGLRKNLGKHFSLMPTFTLSGGFVTINDIVTQTSGARVTSDYTPSILSLNTGLSIAYLFY